MDEDRVRHSYKVAIKMVEIGKNKNLSDSELNELFLLGYLHDIGYQFGSSKDHAKVGGEILKNNNYPYWKEVYYHGIPTTEYESLYLDILNEADMKVDKYGNDVGFEKRLEDIESRYGIDSNVYKSCFELINSLKNKK